MAEEPEKIDYVKEHAPPQKLIHRYCTACGSFIQEILCSYDCPNDATSEEDRPPGSVRTAVYALEEIKPLTAKEGDAP